jgi:hypothetical protein
MFNAINLKIGRANFNDSALESGPAVHIYITIKDTMDEIAEPGYFPPFLGADFSSVRIDDILNVYGVYPNSLNNFITTSYFINAVDPIGLTGFNTIPIYQDFQDLTYTGAASGTTDISFEINQNGVVNVSLNQGMLFTTTSMGVLNFTPNLPPIFTPSVPKLLPIPCSITGPDSALTYVVLEINNDGSMNLTTSHLGGINFSSGDTVLVLNGSGTYIV